MVYTIGYGNVNHGFQCTVCREIEFGDVSKLHSNGAILGSHALSDPVRMRVCVCVHSGVMLPTPCTTESFLHRSPQSPKNIHNQLSFPSYALCLETIIIVINIIAPIILLLPQLLIITIVILLITVQF